VVAGLAVLGGLYTVSNTRESNKIFDPPRFTPFTIISREDISSTSFILTIRPKPCISHPPDSDPYEDHWETGTWSVEFKQPQLQIARSYTPLPPDEHTRNGDLRFLIRKEKGGEVSNYLAALPLGGQVELRGPHPGVDLTEDITDVVFFAGGTGIAPALQVAHTLLKKTSKGNKTPRVHIVWANRRREDCTRGGNVTKSAVAKYPPMNKIVAELESLRLNHPDNLMLEYLVDEEGQLLDQKKVLSLTKDSSQIKYGAITTMIDSKLLILSGPEGFVTYFAGPKKWENGKESQGDIGGVIGRLGLRDWKVWKL
jgi:cytochrome-b5 reductase